MTALYIGQRGGEGTGETRLNQGQVIMQMWRQERQAKRHFLAVSGFDLLQ